MLDEHREANRPSCDTLEEPLDLVSVLAPRLPAFDTVPLDGLTLWRPLRNASSFPRRRESTRH